MASDDLEKPWDVKKIDIFIGVTDLGTERWINLELFDDDHLNITIKDPFKTGKRGKVVEHISLDAAKRLRDFLIYAIKD